MGRLEGKAAIVTGAGAGLGRAYSVGMAKEGASVVVNDVAAQAVEKVVAEIREQGGKAAACVAPVGTRDTAEKLVATAIGEFGRLDILVNNAGVIGSARFTEMTDEQWDSVLQVHLRGSFLNTQAAVRYMIEHGTAGRIINTTSSAGLYGQIGNANYCAAKAGIIGLTKSNSRELARYGICVNAVGPMARTAMSETLPDKFRTEFYERQAKEGTIQRLGEPEDVVPTIVFLASDESYYLTGQVIIVTGTVGLI